LDAQSLRMETEMRTLGCLLTLGWSGTLWAQEVSEESAAKEAEEEVDRAIALGIEPLLGSDPMVEVLPEVAAPTKEDANPSRAVVLEEPPSAEPEAAPEFSVIRLTADGKLLVQGEVVSKRKLNEAIGLRILEAPDSPWRLELEPGADQKVYGSVAGALFSSGIRGAETVDVEPPQPEMSSDGPGKPVVGGPVALMGVARPTGELRFGLNLDQLDALTGDDDHLDPAMAFDLARAEFGFNLDLSSSVSGRATVNLHSQTNNNSIGLDTEGGDSATLELPSSNNGYELGAQEIYIDLRPLEDDRITLRAGSQASIFGSAGMMDDSSGFYTMGPQHESLPVLAGLVNLYDAGVQVNSQVREGQGNISVQAMNSAEDSALGEQDLDKAITGRLSWQVAAPITVAISGMQEKPGDDDNASIGAASVLVDCDMDTLGAMAEFLWGSWDVDSTDDRTDRLVGGQMALRGDMAMGDGAVETLRLVARGAYFDPRSETQDADAWMQLNLSVQGLWDSADDTLVSTGFGYEVEMPMDISQAIEHRALIQAVTRF
jgi:hypothetical protein